MNVACREKSLLPRANPPSPSRSLTLRAGPVSAAVIRDGGAMPAAGALIDMTAECGGTDGQSFHEPVREGFPVIHPRRCERRPHCAINLSRSYTALSPS